MRALITVIVSFALLVVSAALMASTATDGTRGVHNAAASTQTEFPRYPIAPGVWYPGDGPLPDHPVRYYRARCFPGCHSGSRYGKYPDKQLGYHPIFPTSTIHKFKDSADE